MEKEALRRFQKAIPKTITPSEKKAHTTKKYNAFGVICQRAHTPTIQITQWIHRWQITKMGTMPTRRCTTSDGSNAAPHHRNRSA